MVADCSLLLKSCISTKRTSQCMVASTGNWLQFSIQGYIKLLHQHIRTVYVKSIVELVCVCVCVCARARVCVCVQQFLLLHSTLVSISSYSTCLHLSLNFHTTKQKNMKIKEITLIENRTKKIGVQRNKDRKERRGQVEEEWYLARHAC